MTVPLRNWAGNIEFSGTLRRPSSIEQLQEIVASSAKAKALGTRHSFSPIANSKGELIDLSLFNQIGKPVNGQVTVGSGVTYGQLGPELHRNGFAIHNLASLPHISVVGACATATHGSGDKNGNLATAVAALQIVTADGNLIELKRGDEDFAGAVVGLGALGVITNITLDIEPAFEATQEVFENLALEDLLNRFDEITASGYSVSLFSDWKKPRINQVWVKRRVTDGLLHNLKGTSQAPTHRHPIGELSPINCSPQMGEPGPWHERLPHFRMDFTPSAGEELQAEYLVPRKFAVQAIEKVAAMSQIISPLLQINEIRTMAADDLWMSPSYHQPCVGIHFTWVKDWPAVQQVLPKLDEIMIPFEARPHWGKLSTIRPKSMGGPYERLPDFKSLAGRLDPTGKFRNEFLSDLLD